MNSSTECPTATIQYRLNLPHALYSISPALSALHASRAAALHPEASAILHTSHCPKCGTYRFSGDHPTHLVGPPTKRTRRRSRFSHPKVLQRRCHVCGSSVDACASPTFHNPSTPVPLPGGLLRSKTVPAIPQDKEIPAAGAVLTPTCAPILPLPGTRPQSRSGSLKSLALRNMLSRDRRREETANAHKGRKEGRDGLTAFLKEL